MAIKRTFLSTKGYEFIVYPSNLFQTWTFETEEIQYERKTMGRSQDKFFTRIKEIRLNNPRESLDWNISNDDLYDVRTRMLDILKRVTKMFSGMHYAFILHDRDKDVNMEIKKLHFHVYVWVDEDQFPAKAFHLLKNDFNQLKVEIETLDYWERVIVPGDKKSVPVTKEECKTKVLVEKDALSNPIKKLNSALRYMIHIDNDSKYHYDLADAFSDVDLFHHKAFIDATRVSQIEFLMDAIDAGRVETYRDLTQYARVNGCIDTFLKNQWFFTNYIKSTFVNMDVIQQSMPDVNGISVQGLASLDTNLDPFMQNLN